MDSIVESDRISRGRRVQEIQFLCGYGEGKLADNRGFAAKLNEAARHLGLEEEWKPERLSKVRSGTQDLSVEDMTVLAYVDPERRGWTWIAYGLPVSKGEDAWVALARMAKK